MGCTFFTGIVLVIPILLVRFLLLSAFGKDALKRAAFFPPTEGIEKVAYLINILTSLALLIVPFFLKFEYRGYITILGICFLILAFVLYIISIIQFAKPDGSGPKTSGLYSISRNPMYVSFFFYFAACCILTYSLILFSILALFQVSVHFLIISEERWCLNQFGQPYIDYKEKVRRYI